jgi:hypothetical protein
MTVDLIQPWKHTLQTTHAVSKLCFAVEDFAYFDGRKALQEKVPAVYRTQLSRMTATGQLPEGKFVALASLKVAPLEANHDEELQAIAKAAGTTIEEKTKAFGAELEAEAKKKPESAAELPAWKKMMMEKNEARKKEIEGMMDASMDKAMATIEKLPEHQQQQAAERYNSWWDYLMIGFKKIVEFLNKAWDAIVNVWNSVINGITVAVEGAVNSVKEWAGDAVRAVSGAIGKVEDVFRSIF